MVTVKVESEEQMEFLQAVLEYAWKIIHCSVNDIFELKKQTEALCVENKTLELSEKQTETFRTIMQMYNNVSADFIASGFLKQLPGKVKDAPRCYVTFI